MRILMILDHEFPPDIRVENEIEALTGAGHEMHIACYTKENRSPKEIIEKLTIHRRKISGFIYKTSVGALRVPIYFNFWRTFLKHLFQTGQFDAIHVHDLPLAKVGYEFAKKHHCKLVLDLHENWPALLRVATHTQSLLGKALSNNRQWEKYELTYGNKADNIVVVVEEAKNRLASKGIDPKKINIVSNTLNFNHFESPETKPDKNFFTLLYAGGINKHRGLQYVIKGLKLLQKTSKPVRLFILGSGSFTDSLKELAKTEGVEQMIEFTGWKSYKEMQRYFGRADVCLIPHVKNDHTDSTIPHKLFQYMYAKLPVIASNCSSLERILRETQAGIIFPSDNHEKLAEILDSLNEDKKAEMGEKGRYWVEKKYNWDRDKQYLKEIYLSTGNK
jgi:glycosyltransferase involved in cell wall biosynthesis